MDILQVKNLTKIYGQGETQVVALDHIDLNIAEGQFVAVIGPSGSGKSTFLHMLGGVDKPTTGEIIVAGTDIATLNETEMAVFRRRKVGLIYQSYNLIPILDVEKNILLPLLLDGARPEPAELARLTAMLGLTQRLQHLPSQLSGGQKQRVAIGRALICHPSIILADEPTGNLDRENTKATLELLRRSNQEYGQTIVMITHDETIAQTADRIIKIVDGRIVADEVSRQ